MLIFHVFLVSLSLILTFLIIYTFCLLPSDWLCDYGQMREDSDLLTVADASAPIATKVAIPPSLAAAVFILTLLVMLLFSHSYNFRENPLAYLLLLILLMHISISDFLYMIIPDQHLWGILLLGLLTMSRGSFFYQSMGLVVGILPFFLILLLGLIIKKTECIGFGDIKLMAVLGFYTGPLEILYIYFLSSLLSGIFSFFILLLRFISPRFLQFSALNICNNKTSVFALGPFICFSCIFCVSVP